MTFATPQLLWLLLVPLAVLVWELTRARRAGALAQPKILRAEAGGDSLQLSSFNAQRAEAKPARRRPRPPPR